MEAKDSPLTQDFAFSTQLCKHYDSLVYPPVHENRNAQKSEVMEAKDK